MRVSAIVFLLSACVCGLARAERCPSQNQPAEVPAHLNGTLTYHPGVYAWYGLEVSPKVCGERIVQLGFVDNALAREAHRYVGCRVSVSGNLMVPFTGYWSARLGLGEAKLGPVTGCRTGDPLPDYSQVKISSSLKAYRVLAQYDPATTIFQARVLDAATGTSLTPWQAYVSDTGNGARDLQRMFCAQGFTASLPEKSKAENVSEGAADGMPAAIEVQLPDDGKPLTVPFLCTRTAK